MYFMTSTIQLEEHSAFVFSVKEASLSLLQKESYRGSLGGAAVWRLPLAQDAILETRDQIPHQAPGMEPASPSACVSASLSLSVYHE